MGRRREEQSRESYKADLIKVDSVISRVRGQQGGEGW